MINDFYPSTIPWICGGDFNEFLWEWEKAGGAEIRPNRHRYLDDFMREAELMDLEFNGPKFTWQGTRNGNLVEERLDRGLINTLWHDRWPNTSITHGTTLRSDHCHVIVHGEPCVKRGRSLFRYEALWSRESECRDIVNNYWEKLCLGDNMGRWTKKINNCRTLLARWSRKKYKYRGQQIEEMMVQLGQLQEDWGRNIHQITELSNKVDKLWSQE